MIVIDAVLDVKNTMLSASPYIQFINNPHVEEFVSGDDIEISDWE